MTPEEKRAYNKEYNRAYYLANRERLIAAARAYEIANPKSRTEYKRAWKAANKDLVAQDNHKRRANQKAAGVFTIRRSDLAKLYNSACIYCGSTNDIQLDHVVPLAKGGRHSIGNLVPACGLCNRSKADRFLIVWKRQREINKSLL